MADSASLSIIISAINQSQKVFQDIRSDMKSSEATVNSLGGAVTKLGGSLGKLVPAIAAVAAGFASFKTLDSAISSTKELGAEVAGLVRITGLSAEAASHLIAAGKDTGVAYDTLSRSLGIFAKNLKGVTDSETKAEEQASAQLAKSVQSQAQSIQTAGENFTLFTNKMATSQDNLRQKIVDDQQKINDIRAKGGADAAAKLQKAQQALSQDQQRLSDLMLETRTRTDQYNRTMNASAPALKSAEGPTKSFGQALKDLNVTERDVIDSSGALREHAIDILADAFNKMGPGLDRTADAMALFGRSGKDMLPLLALGSKGLQDAAKQADKLGLTLTGKNVDAIRAYGRSQREMGEAVAGVKLQIGLALMPALTQLAHFFVENQPIVRAFVIDGIGLIKDGVDKAATAFKKLPTPIQAIVSPIAAAVIHFRELKTAAQGLFDLFSLGLQGGQIGGQFAALEKVAFGLGVAFRTTLIPAFHDAEAAMHLFLLAVQGGSAGGNLSSLQKTFLNLGTQVRQSWLNDIKPALSAFADIVKTVVRFIIEHWGTISNVFKIVAADVKEKIGGMLEIIKGVVEIVSGVVQGVDDALHGRWAEVWEDFKKVVQGAIDVSIGYFREQYGLLGQILYEKGKAAGAAFIKGLSDGLGTVGKSLLKGAIDLGSTAIPGQASGTNSWRGGLTWVGEKGPEIVNLPKGSQVFSNPQSMALVGHNAGGTFAAVGIGGFASSSGYPASSRVSSFSSSRKTSSPISAKNGFINNGTINIYTSANNFDMAFSRI